MRLSEESESSVKFWTRGFYNYGEMLPYFRVTEEQYDELTEDFYQAKQLATQEIQKVTYTYDELFGE